jgi:hypothetical protein
VPKANILRCSKERRYSITSSEIASTPDGVVKASALAVSRLITSSNVVDWIIGKSAGLVPLRILLVYKPTCCSVAGTVSDGVGLSY